MKIKLTIKHLKILLALIILGRFIMNLYGDWTCGNFVPQRFVSPQSKSWVFNLIPDDLEISRTAYFYLQTKHFVTDVSFDRPKFRTEMVWPSAFRNRYNIIYDTFLIKTYEYFWGPIKLDSTNNLPDRYLTFYAVVLFCLKWLLLLAAIIPLYKCARLFLNDFWSMLFLIGWELFPSNFYIFPLNCLDNIAISIATIIVSLFILMAVKKKISFIQIAFLGLLCCWGFSVKFHILSISIAMCVFGIFYGAIKRRFVLFFSFSSVLLLHFCIIVPLLWSTEKTIGHPVISTQSGLNLFHGHNPIARGSWSPQIWAKYPEVLNPLLDKEKVNLSADEYTETETYKKMAIHWALSHPKQELLLSIKKILIFFTPYNFMCWQFNPFTLIVYLGFILFTFLLLIHPSRYTVEYWLLIIVPWSMVAFNVLYFVEYRWRYLVEPEMTLATFILIKIVYDKIINTRQAIPAT